MPPQKLTFSTKWNTTQISTAIETVMKSGCITVGPEMLAAEAVQLMQTKKINGLVVVDKQNRPVGAFNMHDVLKAGVV